MRLKAYNVICTNDISEDYDVDALGATDFEAYACDDVDEHIGKLEAELAALKEELRWRDASKELPPKEKGIFSNVKCLTGRIDGLSLGLVVAY